MPFYFSFTSVGFTKEAMPTQSGYDDQYIMIAAVVETLLESNKPFHFFPSISIQNKAHYCIIILSNKVSTTRMEIIYTIQSLKDL